MLAVRRRLPPVSRSKRTRLCLMIWSSVSGQASPGSDAEGSIVSLLSVAFASCADATTCEEGGSMTGAHSSEDDPARVAQASGLTAADSSESHKTLCGFMMHKVASDAPPFRLSHSKCNETGLFVQHAGQY